MLPYFCDTVLKTVRFVKTCPLLHCVLFRSVRQILLFSLCLCLSLFPPLSPSLFVSVFVSLCLCLSLSLLLSVCLSFFPCLSVCLSVPLSLECRSLLVWDRNCRLKQSPEIRNRSYNNSSSSCFLQFVCRACVDGTIEVNANPACYQHSM